MLSKPKLVSFAFVALFVVCFPRLLSTDIGNQVFSGAVSSFISKKVQIKARFRYFEPIKMNQLIIFSNQGTFQSNDVIIDQFFKSFFSKTPCQILVRNFEISWQPLAIKTVHQASLFGLLPTFYPAFDCLFSHGKIYDAQSMLRAHSVSGQILGRKNSPIDFIIKAEGTDGGFLEAEGKFDSVNGNTDTRLNIQQFPTSALPQNRFIRIFGPELQGHLYVKGSFDQAHVDYDLRSSQATFAGSFKKIQQLITIENPLEININAPYLEYGPDINFKDIKGQLYLNSGVFSLKNISSVSDLFGKASLQIGQANFFENNIKELSTQAQWQQDHDILGLSISTFQEKTQILNIQGKIDPQFSKDFSVACKTRNFPLFLFFKTDKDLGEFLDFELETNLSKGLLSGHFKGSIDSISNFESQFEYKNQAIQFLNFQALYKKDYQITASSLMFTLPFKNTHLANGNFIITAEDLSDPSSSFFPLKANIDMRSYEEILIDISHQYGKLSGPIAFDPQNKDLIISDKWEGLATFTPSDLPQMHLKNKAIATLQIFPGSLLGSLAGEINFSPFGVTLPQNLDIQNLKVIISNDFKKQKLFTELKSTYRLESSEEGSCFAKIEFKNSMFEQGSLEFKKLPLLSLGLLHPELQKLGPILGDSANGTVKIKQALDQKMYELMFQSAYAQLSGSFTIGESIQVVQPIQAVIKLNNLNIPFFANAQYFSLKKPCDIQMNILNLDIPFKKGTSQDWTLVLDSKISNLSLAKNQKNIQLDGFYLKTSKNKNQSLFNLEFSGDLYSSFYQFNKPQANLTTGSLQGHFSIDAFYQALAKDPLKVNQINGQLKLDSFPTLFLDFFLQNFDNPFTSSLGDVLQAQISINHQPSFGSIEAYATGKDSLFKIHASKKGPYYSLKEDAIAQFKLSPELSKLLFFKNPLGIEKLSSNYPIVCRFGASGSQFTLFPFEKKYLVLPDCQLDFARVVLDANALLPQALNLLKTTSNKKNLAVWFQPIKGQIQYGFITVPRFDFLVNDAYQMALWGNVDLNQNQVGMILGLTASCLQKAFKISELPYSYVLQIPVYGTLDDVKIDSKKAASKIAKIMALQQGGSLLEQFGGKQGGIVGGLLKELSKLPDADKKAPEPVLPYPWEGPAKPASQKKDRKKGIRSSDSPVKQIMKMFF